MEIEQYFNFLSEDDIRIAGTRVGIETVLYDYIYRSQTAAQTAHPPPPLPPEQVYATILYYLHNREKVEAYIVDWLEHGERMRREQEKNLPPVILRLRRIAAQTDTP